MLEGYYSIGLNIKQHRTHSCFYAT